MPDAQHDKLFSTQRIVVLVIALVAAVAVLYLLRFVIETLLVIFAGVLLGILLDGVSVRLSKRLHVSRGLALGIVILLLTAAVVGIGVFAGPRVANQLSQLTTRIPEAIETIRMELNQYGWGRLVVENAPSIREILTFGRQELISATDAFSTVVGAVINVLIILVIGIYLAATPGLYLNNALRLLPTHRRERTREIAVTINDVLQRWLVGRVASMLVVGVLMGAGLWIVGIPLAFTLGVIAAILSFIPYIGPVLSTVPAILVALAGDPELVVYALVVFGVVQFLESYVITPLIQRQAVSIPPALLISVQILMGAMFGGLGIFLATPTAVIAIVAIQLLYVEDVLGDKVRILGDHGG